MLVRNMSRIVLKSRNKGVDLTIPVGEVVEVDETIFTEKRLKEIWGNFIRISAEVKEDEVPAKPEADLETEENNNNVSVADATNNEENTEDEADSDKGDVDGADTENVADDTDDIDNLVDEVLESLEGEANKEADGNKEPEGKEETEEDKPAKPKRAKSTKAKKTAKK